MLKVLILEDQGIVRAGISALIQISEPNSEIHEASTYEESLDKFNRNCYDFAFLDYDLKADKSGLDVLKFLREENIDTRAIMLSGVCQLDIVVSCLNFGASGFIPKGLEEDQVFRKAIDTVLQGGIFVPDFVFNQVNSGTPKITLTTKEWLVDSGVSGRPLQVLIYLCQGLSNKSIARKMNIDEGTIRRDYVPKLFRIFKVSRRTELVIEVSRLGLILPNIGID